MKRSIKFAFRITLVVFTVIILNSCIIVNPFDYNTVSGKGSPENYEIKTGQFDGINVKGFCDIRYYAASSDTVTLSVQPNLREFFIIEVVNGDLVVNTTKRINFKPGFNPVLTVSAPVLNRLTIEGACNFTAYEKIVSDSLTITFNGAGESKTEIDTENLLVNISGAGKMNLSGNAKKAEFNMSGAGEVAALSLSTVETNVSFSGAGSLTISCSDKLNIDASGVGSVAYRGNPVVNINKNGLVDIKRVN